MYFKHSSMYSTSNPVYGTGEDAAKRAYSAHTERSQGPIGGLLIASLVSTPFWILLYALFHQAATSFR
jgi:hypothetical protein